MPTITGNIRDVTGTSAGVKEILVRAHRTRAHGDGLIIDTPHRIPVEASGRVQFSVESGAAILVVLRARQPVESVPLVIPSGDTTLAEAYRQGALFNDIPPERLEDIARDISTSMARIEDAARRAESARAGIDGAASGVAEQVKAGKQQLQATVDAKREEMRAIAQEAYGTYNTAYQSLSQMIENYARNIEANQQQQNEMHNYALEAYRKLEAAEPRLRNVTDTTERLESAVTRAEAAAEEARQATEVARTGVEDASTEVKGKVRLAGDLSGTADEPTVPGLANKADRDHTHTMSEVRGLDSSLSGKRAATTGANTIAVRYSNGALYVPSPPTNPSYAASKRYVDEQVSGKANTNHTHSISQVSGLQTALDGKAARDHTHPVGDIDGLNALLSAKADSHHTHRVADISDLDGSFVGKRVHTSNANTVVLRGNDSQVWVPSTPSQNNHAASKKYVDDRTANAVSSQHTHQIRDVTGLQAALDSKANTSHTHTMSQVNGLQTALDGKAPTRHSHNMGEITGLQNALNAKASSNHTHTMSQVTGLERALEQKASINHVHTVNQINDLPTISDTATANSLAKRDSSGRVTVATPTAGSHAATKAYVDAKIVVVDRGRLPQQKQPGVLYFERK